MMRLVRFSNECCGCAVAKFIFLAGLFLCSSHSLSQSACNAIFPDGASSASASSTLAMGFAAKVFGSPDGELDTQNPNFNSGSRCGTGTDVCTSSGNSVDQMSYSGGFPSGQPNLIIAFQATATVSPGDYKSIDFGGESTITMEPGIYSATEDVDIGSLVNISLSAPGTVVIYSQGNVGIGSDTIINSTAGSRAFFVFSQSDIEIGSRADVTGVIYAKGEFELKSRGELKGAASAEDDVTLGSRAEITFDASVIAATDFDGMCTAGSALSLDTLTLTPSTSTASVCRPVDVVITARDQNGDVFTDYDGTINLSTTLGNGNWSKTGSAADAFGTLNIGAVDSGVANYTFASDGSDAGSVVLEFSNTRLQTVNLRGEDTSENVVGTFNGVMFTDNTFVFEDAAGFNQDVIAGRSHAFTVTALKIDNDNGDVSCGVATNYNVDNMKAWVSRELNDPGGIAPTIIDDDSVQQTLPESMPASNNVSMNFVNGVSTISLLGVDVGQVSVQLADNTQVFTEETILGGSDSLTVRPFGLALSITDNAGASDQNGSLFKQAGENFSVTATAVGWAAADDTNNDGIPDGHDDSDPTNNVDLSNNSVLNSFGNELLAEEVELNAHEVSRSPADLNVLASGAASGDGREITAFVNGAGSSSNVRYGNVGIIEVTASIADGQYLSASASQTNKILGASGYVGRFYPAAFSVTAANVNNACSTGAGFTYIGEGFFPTFSLQAVNQQGDITTNYQGDYAKYVGNITDSPISARELISAQDISNLYSSYGSSSGAGWVNGVLSNTLSMQHIHSGTPTGPFAQVELSFLPTDSDGVTALAANLNSDPTGSGTNTTVRLGELNFRRGRIRLADSFGPETAPLPVEFVVEYWNTNQWLVHEDDSCTALPLDAIQYAGNAINIVANRTVSVGGGSTTGVYGDINAITMTFLNGNAEHSFTAPGTGNTGSFNVDVNITNLWWLAFDWNNNGVHWEYNLPTAQYTFGSYRGHDRIVHWQEVLN